MSSDIDSSLKKLNKMLEIKSEGERIRLEEELLHLSFISVIEEIMDQRNLKKSNIANVLSSSKGYISQLFSGYKMINIKTLNKLQKALNVTFRISAIDNRKFEFQTTSCSTHHRHTIKDFENDKDDRPYYLRSTLKKKDKIPA